MILHISNRPEISLLSILKSFVDTFVSFLKREVIIISLCNENIVVLHYKSLFKEVKKGKKVDR